MEAEEKLARRDFRQDLTDRIVEAIENGTSPWQKGWVAGDRRFPYNPTTGKSYRGGNTLRLMLEQRDDPRWMTYKQAAEQGWQVRKGERGASIEYWKFEQRGAADSASEGDAELAVEGKNGDQRGTRARVFYATVFNAQQIDGIPPREVRELTWNPVERGEQIIAATGVDLQYDGGDKAFYNPSFKPNTIHLPERAQFHSVTEFYDTVFHEIGHWTGHKDRLDRDLSGEFGDESYAKEELRAEIAAAFVSAEAGIARGQDNNIAYVASWVRALKNDNNEIFRAASDAQKIADFVLSRELELKQSPPLEMGESRLPVVEFGPNDVVDRREEFTLGFEQTMRVVGRSEDGSRVYGKIGTSFLSVDSSVFVDAREVFVDAEVLLTKGPDGHDKAVELSRDLWLGR